MMAASSSVLTSRTSLKVSFALAAASSASFLAKISFSPGCGPKSFCALSTSKRPYSTREENAMARLPGMVHGVVVQMTTETPERAGAASFTGNFTQIMSLSTSAYSTSASASAVRSTTDHMIGLEPR
ncbi:hypothetical protein D3C78_1165020 [compost metagenome]